MEHKDFNEEFEIDVKELFSVILGEFRFIFMAAITMMLVAFLFSKYAIEPQFKSTTKIYVMNKQDREASVTYGDLQSGTQLTKDYMALVTSRFVSEQVIASLGLDMEYEKLISLISVKNPTDTRILEITVRYKDPFIAKKIADALREASQEHITQVMDIEKVNLVEEANIPDGPSDPNIKVNTLLGGALGIIIACFILLLKFFMDDTIKTPDDIEKYLGISVLSTIPLERDMIEFPSEDSQKIKIFQFIKNRRRRKKSGNDKYQ